MAKLSYLAADICALLEIYYSGRTGGQYFKTAFILCDDCTELASKLFLVTDNPKWFDKNSKGNFKNYHETQVDIQEVFKAKHQTELSHLEKLHAAMKDRHMRRNEFFHSTHLLDLTVTYRECVEALCDLMEYGKLLFGGDWDSEISSPGHVETLHTLLQLEKRSFLDKTIMARVDDILREWPRREKDKPVKKTGTQFAVHPEDFHLRMCVIWGGRELCEKLKALLGT